MSVRIYRKLRGGDWGLINLIKGGGSLKKGNAKVAIVILTAIILIALIPWLLIIARYLDIDIYELFTPSEEIEELADTEDGQRVDEPPVTEPVTEPEQENHQPPDPDSEQGSFADSPPEDTIINIKDLHPELFRELNDTVSRYKAVAVSMTVYDGEAGEFFTYEYGNADVSGGRLVNTDTKLRIASLAKLTTVICAMILFDEGLLDLDTDISVYLGYEVKNSGYPDTAITTRMLMQHTSSIFDSGAFQSSRENDSSQSIRSLLDQSTSSERSSSFRRSEPGTNFEYSNFGYAVLGAVCENVAGKTLNTLAHDALFAPLGIDAAYLPATLHETGNIAVLYNDRHDVTRSVESQLLTSESEILGHDLHLAQGNLTISTVDYAKILAMLGNGGVYHDVKILSGESVRAINLANVKGAAYDQGLATRYTFGDFVSGEGFYWHTGSAYGLFSQYLYSGEGNRGVVVATTGAATSREPNGMVTVCSELSAVVWRELNQLKNLVEGEEIGEN